MAPYKGPRKQVMLRLPSAELARLDEYAAERQLDRSSAVVALMDDAIRSAVEPKPQLKGDS